jgi:hypothetical protein
MCTSRPTVNNKSTQNTQNIHRKTTADPRCRGKPPGATLTKKQNSNSCRQFMAADDREFAGHGDPVVEQFRVPFVRGFGYDDDPIVQRRIKS